MYVFEETDILHILFTLVIITSMLRIAAFISSDSHFVILHVVFISPENRKFNEL